MVPGHSDPSVGYWHCDASHQLWWGEVAINMAFTRRRRQHFTVYTLYNIIVIGDDSPATTIVRVHIQCTAVRTN